MRCIIAALFSTILLFAAALSQQTPAQTRDTQTPRSDEQPGQPTENRPATAPTRNNQVPATNPLKIAPGSVIPVQLAKTVDAKKAKTGDEVVATVTQDMKTNSGEVLVPKDTKVIGHVTEAQARNKQQKQSELGIAFDHAVVKGDQMPLPMSIQAVIAPQNNSPENGGASPAPESAPSAGSAPGGTSGGHQGSMGGGSAPQSGQQNYPQGSASQTQAQTNARPPITAKTEGVLGMSDVKLETAAQNPPNSTQGSVLSSEKNNVKIEKGTMMLLRVNQAQ